MDTRTPLALLGGLTAEQFMKRHWQKKPLLIRQALPGFKPCVSRSDLVALAARDDVESRLIVQKPAGWTLRHGPLPRRSLPPFAQKRWTFLVQGVDLHHDGVHDLLQQFRFVPDARLDDVMISYATDGGGVGPHYDSYDVFLLQAHGRRRWRIGRQKDLSLEPDVPLKILSHFEPEQEWVLEPGDMLYLPPQYAHDGVAEGECMTWSVGFRVPQEAELARDLLLGLADEATDALGETLYRDPAQPAVSQPAEIPPALQDFARRAVQKALRDPEALNLLLGETFTEPKPQVWFEAPDAPVSVTAGVALDRRTRMMYDARHVFINGEGFRVSGRDTRLLRQLADERRLDARAVDRLSEAAREALVQWLDNGWLKTLSGLDPIAAV